MPSYAVPVWCHCDHAEADHRSDGSCRERDEAGQPCGCRQFEADEG